MKPLELNLNHNDRITGKDCKIELIEDVLIDEDEMEIKYRITPIKHAAIVFVNFEPYAVYSEYDDEWYFFKYMSPSEAQLRFPKLKIEYKILINKKEV